MRPFLFEFARQLVEAAQNRAHEWRSSRPPSPDIELARAHRLALDALEATVGTAGGSLDALAAVEDYRLKAAACLLNWTHAGPDSTFGQDLGTLLESLDAVAVELSSVFAGDPIVRSPDLDATPDAREPPGAHEEPTAGESAGQTTGEPPPGPPDEEESLWRRVRGVALRISGDRLPEERHALIRGLAAARLTELATLSSRLERWLEVVYGSAEDADAGDSVAPPDPDPAEVVRAGHELQSAVSSLEPREVELAQGLVELADRHARDFIEDARRVTDARIRWPGLARARAEARAAGWRERSEFAPRLAAERARIQHLAEVARFLEFASDFVPVALLARGVDQSERVQTALRRAEMALREHHEEAKHWLDTHPDAPLEDYESRARAWAAAALEKLTVGERDINEISKAESAVDAASTAIARWHERVGQLPSQSLISPHREPDDGDAALDDDPVAVEPRQWAADAFDAPLMEEAFRASELYLPAFEDASGALRVARSVIEYNLVGTVDSDALAEEGEPRRLACELILGGLYRGADGIAAAATRVASRTADAQLVAWTAFERGWRRFRARVEADGSLEGRAADAWSDVRRGALTVGETAAESLERGLQMASRLMRLGRARARLGVERFRKTMGTENVESDRVLAAAGEVARIDAVAMELPFVYRRLFSYDPVEDPSFLAGRERELAEISSHLGRRARGFTTPLVLVGSPGAGATSLLRVVGRDVNADRWRWISLSERPETEVAWARQLATGIGLSSTPDSLEALEGAIRASSLDGCTVVIDQAESLFWRGTLDSGLLAPTLSLMSATRDCLVWAFTISSAAWQVLSAGTPGTARLATTMVLSPLTRTGTEEAIVRRHQRSGLPIVYREEEFPARVARAARRVTTPEARQTLFRTAVFDRIHALGEGYPALSMVHWLRTIRFDPESDSMHVGWPAPLDVGVWSSLSRDAAYLIRAIFEHGALSSDEAAAILGTETGTSLSLFEELAALLIVEPSDATRPVGSRLEIHPVRAGQRYRVRPVLVRPAEQLLESRRILY